MNSFRASIELYFAKLVHLIFRHRWFVLIATLIITGILVTQIRHLEVDTSTEAFFFDDDPEIVTYDRFREQFGSPEIAVVAIRTTDVFSRDFLLKLRDLHQALEENVPFLDDITSLVNVTATRGEGDELIVEELMKDWPDDPAAQTEFIAFIKQYAGNHELYRNYILSEDHRYTAIILKAAAFAIKETTVAEDISDEFFNDGTEEDTAARGDKTGSKNRKLTDKENAAFVKSLFDITRHHHADDFSIFIAGRPVLSYAVQSRMQRDVPRFTALAITIIFALLAILFRRVTGVLLPLIVVVVAMLATMALFGIFNRPFTVITQIIPSFIISVGVCDSVHILAVFYRHYAAQGDKEAAMAFAMGHSGLAVLMTSLTTAGGLLSFAGAKIAPIADLGIFASAGVVMALIYTIVLIPALIAVVPVRRKQGKGQRSENLFDNILVGMGDFAIRKPVFVTLTALLIVIIASVGIARLRFSHNPIAWFPDDDPFPLATATIDAGLKGSMTLEALLETNTDNALYQPGLMNKLNAFSDRAATVTESTLFVGKTLSIVDTLKQIHKSLNENRDEFLKVPQNKNLIAQEMILFENGGTDDLDDLVDRRYSKARITIKLPWEDANAYTGIQQKLTDLLNEMFRKDGTVVITGMISLLTRTIYNVIISMMTSYIIAGVVISLLMILLLGSIKYGLLSMIPNVFPIVIALGLMGFAGMNLDLSNILIGSIIIGLAVDDTVHFFHNFRRYYAQSGDVRKSVKTTMLTTGRALLFTTLVLVGGFVLFVISDMKNLVNFGIITAIAMMTALLADLLLAPALMALVAPPRDDR